MVQMIQHLLAGLLTSVTLVGGGATVTEIPSPPGGIDPQNPPGLAEFVERVPDAARIDCTIIQNRTGSADSLVPDGPDWNESFGLSAYDADGRLLGTATGSANMPASAMSITLYAYDAASNSTRSSVYVGEQLISETVRTQDAQGRDATYISYQDGVPDETVDYTYTPQADGTLLCTQTTRRADGTTSESSYVVDETGNPLHTETQIGDKTITTDFTYDEKGRTTLVVYDYGATVPSETHNAYTDAADGSYTCISELYDNGTLLSRTEQQYDTWGIYIYEAQHNPDGELLREMTVYTLKP